jgi:hypothetical protein
MRCERSPLRPFPAHTALTFRIPESASYERSCATSVPSFVRHQSRARKRAMTPSRLAPCHTRMPPGASTREFREHATVIRRLGEKPPNDVNRFTTASNRPVHVAGSDRMSPRR